MLYTPGEFPRNFADLPAEDRLALALALEARLVRAAENALMVQSAGNLVAIARSFAEDMRVIFDASNLVSGHDNTEWRNLHPVSRLYAEQVVYLTSGAGSSDMSDSYSRAYAACSLLSDRSTKDRLACGLLLGQFGIDHAGETTMAGLWLAGFDREGQHA